MRLVLFLALAAFVVVAIFQSQANASQDTTCTPTELVDFVTIDRTTTNFCMKFINAQQARNLLVYCQNYVNTLALDANDHRFSQQCYRHLLAHGLRK